MEDKSPKFRKGSRIQWKWLGRVISGKVVEKYTEPVVKEIKGKRIKRNGSVDKPAYLVESDAGNLALKLASELQPWAKTKSAWKD